MLCGYRNEDHPGNSKNGTLLVDSTTRADAGNYSCTVTHGNSTVAMATQVIIKGNFTLESLTLSSSMISGGIH